MITLHYKEDLKVVLETVFANGDILDNPTGRTINPGHCIENSWFLMNYAVQTSDEELLNKCVEVKRILIASINTAKENNK